MENSQGWKLPDFMLATRRSLSDACDSVGNQIDGFYSSLSVSSTSHSFSTAFNDFSFMISFEKKLSRSSILVGNDGTPVR